MNPKVEKIMSSSLDIIGIKSRFACTPTNKAYFHLWGTFQTNSAGIHTCPSYVANFSGTTAHCGHEPRSPRLCSSAPTLLHRTGLCQTSMGLLQSHIRPSSLFKNGCNCHRKWFMGKLSHRRTNPKCRSYMAHGVCRLITTTSAWWLGNITWLSSSADMRPNGLCIGRIPWSSYSSKACRLKIPECRSKFQEENVDNGVRAQTVAKETSKSFGFHWNTRVSVSATIRSTTRANKLFANRFPLTSSSSSLLCVTLVCLARTVMNCLAPHTPPCLRSRAGVKIDKVLASRCIYEKFLGHLKNTSLEEGYART